MAKSTNEKRIEALERQYKLESNILNSGHPIKIGLWVWNTIHNLPVPLQEEWAAKFDALVLDQIKRMEHSFQDFNLNRFKDFVGDELSSGKTGDEF